MNKIRALVVVAVAALAAACSTSPTKPSAPAAAPTPPPAAVPAVASLAGNWVVTIESQMGSQDSKLTLTQNGSNLAGTMESPMGSVAVQGSVAGNDVKMWFNINAQGMDLKIDFIGTQEGGTKMKGKAVFGTFGEGTFTAKKS